MSDLFIERKPVAHLQFAFNNLLNNPIILFPFCILAFIQLFIFEFIYFVPRYPLSRLLAPLLRNRVEEAFLHYPFNYLLLADWYQKVQLPVFVLFTSFFLGCAVAIIQALNDNQEVNFQAIFKRNLVSYVHLAIANVLSVLALYGLSFLQNIIMKRAVLIRSANGLFYIIKKIVLEGAVYYQLILSVLATTLLAFVIPIIIIERKSILAAVVLNFKRLRGLFWFAFVLLLLPVLLYVPLLMLKANLRIIDRFISPELYGALIILSSMVLIFIDAVQCTAITTLYLYKRESK